MRYDLDEANQIMTLCDRCGCEIPQEEANDGDGEWEGAMLCNDCYATVSIPTEEEEMR